MKNFKFFVASAVLALMMVPSVFAQTKANFAGTWQFNEAKSTQSEFRMAADKLVVTQDANTLAVERTSQFGPQNEKFTLDGKECSNPGFGESIRKSTVTFSADGKVMTINSVTPFEWEGQKSEFKSSEVWKLTPEGQLSIENTFNGQQGEMKSTAVYDKK